MLNIDVCLVHPHFTILLHPILATLSPTIEVARQQGFMFGVHDSDHFLGLPSFLAAIHGHREMSRRFLLPFRPRSFVKRSEEHRRSSRLDEEVVYW
jgi:hypothetical protein